MASEQHNHEGHTVPEVFDEVFWEERYRSTTAVWSGNPNAQLVAEASDLPAGAALDVGCGEGADTLWLASRGWQVTAVDFSTVALQRAAAKAEELGIGERVDWVHTDVVDWTPAVGCFDLVSAQFMHLPAQQRDVLYARLAASVAPGGSLVIVGHHPSHMHSAMDRPEMRGMFFTGEDLAAALDPAEWDVVAVDARSRPAIDPDGREITLQDAVLHARKLR
ncbi:MAG: putative reductase [Amycolatopsis sp.]|jgi:SAM-dependent methyltransferase|nr:putative reductase [Amycolatopsis sp.]